jgi:sialate O-acetylesterase
MKTTFHLRNVGAFLLLLILSSITASASEKLKVHGVFRSNMVLQREKPITVWGWAPEGKDVEVSLGSLSAKGKASGEKGRWEVVFAAQPANTNPQKLTVKAGDEVVNMDGILIGDVWVMYGQSNMAIALKTIYEAQFEASMAHLPLMRHLRIQSGAESEYVETDIKEEFINDDNDRNWKVVTPEVALEMGAIGYVFGSRIQRSLQIPIGIIDNARGGASIESLVPRHKFADHPMAAEYLAWVDKRRSEFSEEAFLKAEMEKWEKNHKSWQEAVEKDKAKGVTAKRKEPQKPDGSIRTWSVPGRSPSDAASVYNGKFGAFKGLNIKGVAFHQGFNNAMMNTSCKPEFYRILMKLMVEGIREDFNDPELPMVVIGFCAGGNIQTRRNFEEEGFSTGAFIREAQRLGLADAGNPKNAVYISSDDQRIPQLHTKKKKELGLRAAQWALNTIYGNKNIPWESATLLSAVPEGGAMLLTFDKPVLPDDMGSEIEGFSIADKSGVFYMAEAVAKVPADKSQKNTQILVSSPLVKEPVHVRYSWANSPMGNLKVNGLPSQPLHNFRTDNEKFAPEVAHQDPEGQAKNSAAIKTLKAQATAALQTRIAGPQPNNR